jgi:serine/threonine protein kinase
MTLNAEGSRVGTTFGKYTIIGVLGKGGMGEVYEAYDNEIKRAVALKIIKSEYADDRRYRMRFERESHAAAKLQEPHVIPIHGYGEINGCLFIDMRLVRGADLQSLIDKAPLNPSRAVAVIAQIAAALDAAHAEGLIHRDVKPQNIIVTPADFAYLVDFGIAESTGEKDTRLTAMGAQIGSWVYMAPERFTDQDLTPSVDVYSLTCVLYESLTGQTPFPAVSQEALVAAHLTYPPPRPSVTNSAIPVAFDDVIARGMAKEPDDRYGSAGALARAANRALQGAGRTVVHPVESPPTQPRWQPQPQPQPQPWPQPELQPQQRPQQQPQQQPQHDPPGLPPSEPAPVASGEKPADRGSRWLLPTVIAVSAALVLGAIGVVIGLLAKLNSGPSPSPSGATTAPIASATSSNPTTSSQFSPIPVPSRPGAAVPPPIVTGPDESATHTSCDLGYRLNNVTGFGTHAGRGSAATSCYFANTVLVTYWNTYGNASTSPRTVSAPGAVDCYTVAGAVCDPKNKADFLLQCSGDGSNPWIKCTGGKDAIVYLW